MAQAIYRKERRCDPIKLRLCFRAYERTGCEDCVGRNALEISLVQLAIFILRPDPRSHEGLITMQENKLPTSLEHVPILRRPIVAESYCRVCGGFVFVVSRFWLGTPFPGESGRPGNSLSRIVKFQQQRAHPGGELRAVPRPLESSKATCRR